MAKIFVSWLCFKAYFKQVKSAVCTVTIRTWRHAPEPFYLARERGVLAVLLVMGKVRFDLHSLR